MKQMALAAWLLAVILVTACGPEPTAAPTEPAIGMPNPASKFCVDQGYEIEIRDEAGGQVGYCLFPDGSECEEWAFYRGECAPGSAEARDTPQPASTQEAPAQLPNPASQNCIDQGGTLSHRNPTRWRAVWRLSL